MLLSSILFLLSSTAVDIFLRDKAIIFSSLLSLFNVIWYKDFILNRLYLNSLPELSTFLGGISFLSGAISSLLGGMSIFFSRPSFLDSLAKLNNNNNNILFYSVIRLVAVGWILVSRVFYSRTYSNFKSTLSHKNVSNATLIELILTIIPALILISIALPYFNLLYLMNEPSDASMAVLAEGLQAYSGYMSPDGLDIHMNITSLLNTHGVTPKFSDEGIF